MSVLPSNAVPRDDSVIYYNTSLFSNKTHSKSGYRPLPEEGGFQFMKLPAEIRNMIWELTIEQRLVEVRFTKYELRHDSVTHDFIADVPIALHICQESRNFAMGHYELAFDHRGAFAPVYFNFKLDILYPRASCSKEQLRFLINNMDERDCERVTQLAMYNEHLERTRFLVLLKSFVDPTTVDENTLPPIHWCQREKKQEGHSRRTHFLLGKKMRRDPMHSGAWAMEKAISYRKNLIEAARGSRWVWKGADVAIMGFCEHGLEFEEAPGLAYKGKFFRNFDDQKERIKKRYIPGTVTGTVKSQKEAEKSNITSEKEEGRNKSEKKGRKRRREERGKVRLEFL